MFNSETMPLWFALVIIVAILIPCISVLRVYSRYRRVAKTLPNPRSIEQTKPATLDQKRDQLATTLLEDWHKVPEQDQDATRRALWTAMLLVTVSDGNIDPRELDFVSDLFSKLAGNSPQDGQDLEPAPEAADRIHSDKKSALSEISKASAISTASKDYILSGAFLVSVSDHALAESETDCLGDIADALAIRQRDRKAIFQGITKRLGV